MKLLLTSVGVAAALIVFVGVVLAEGEDFLAIRDLCSERNNITESEFEELSDPVDPSEFDNRFKCMAHCMIDEMGFLDEEGKIDLDKVEEDEHVDEEHLATIMECKAKHDLIEDPCEYSFNIMICAMELA